MGEETNLVPNGDFSAGLEDWTVSDGDGACAIRIDPDTKSGDKNVKQEIRQEIEKKSEAMARERVLSELEDIKKKVQKSK